MERDIFYIQERRRKTADVDGKWKFKIKKIRKKETVDVRKSGCEAPFFVGSRAQV
jgi:hypothetical protein